MDGLVYTKTAAGLDEIQQRRLKLGPRQRNLLVMIDGKRSVRVLLAALASAGVTNEHFESLVEAGLIVDSATIAALALADEETQAQTEPHAGGEAPVSAESERILALYKVCNEVIRSQFGLRGYNLQLQLEKASSLIDYRLLGQEIYQGLKKGRGDAVAADFKARIKPLLV